jgi:hypothetical protein
MSVTLAGPARMNPLVSLKDGLLRCSKHSRGEGQKWKNGEHHLEIYYQPG